MSYDILKTECYIVFLPTHLIDISQLGPSWKYEVQKSKYSFKESYLKNIRKTKARIELFFSFKLREVFDFVSSIYFVSLLNGTTSYAAFLMNNQAFFKDYLNKFIQDLGTRRKWCKI